MKFIIFASVLLVLFFSSSALGFSLSLKHTILSAPLTQFQKHQQLLKLSKCRACNIHAQLAPSLTGYFYVELNIGTPPVRANLVFDSGSSLTWAQSAHCKVCFPVAVPNFDPRRSITYQRMPINHPLCPSGSELAAASKYCSYELKYYDGQVTRGDMSLDTFSFEVVDGSGSKQFPDVAFGLGNINQNITDLVKDPKNPISGVFGIGRDSSSILQQLSYITLNKFSYCLPLLLFGDSDQHHLNHRTSLHFGDDANITGLDVQSTPIFGNALFDSYYLKLETISFNEKPLPIDPTLFLTDGLGMVIDSGSSYTIIVETAYKELRQAVVDYFLMIAGLKPLASTRSGFPLCFNDSILHQGGYYAFPSIRLHFQGPATLELTQATSFQDFEDVNEFCFMIIPSPDDEYGANLLGAFQQANYRFLYDVGASKLSFAPEIC